MVRTVAVEPKRWLHDYDTDVVDETPPIQNTWYEVFDAEDVRLIYCKIYQSNDPTNARNIHVRWTIDGTVYYGGVNAANDTQYYVFRNYEPSTGGTLGLGVDVVLRNGAYYTDKRGLEFKVEVMTPDAVLAGARLLCYAVRETLEIT